MISTYLFECSGANIASLSVADTVMSTLKSLADICNLHVMSETLHEFDPQGVSAALVLAESHIAVHTWPETGSAYVLLASCRPLDAVSRQRATSFLTSSFGNCKVVLKELV